VPTSSNLQGARRHARWSRLSAWAAALRFPFASLRAAAHSRGNSAKGKGLTRQAQRSFAALRMTWEVGRGDRLGRPGHEVNAYGGAPTMRRTPPACHGRGGDVLDKSALYGLLPGGHLKGRSRDIYGAWASPRIPPTPARWIAVPRWIGDLRLHFVGRALVNLQQAFTL